jgi:hypothetical protein
MTIKEILVYEGVNFDPVVLRRRYVFSGGISCYKQTDVLYYKTVKVTSAELGQPLGTQIRSKKIL